MHVLKLVARTILLSKIGEITWLWDAGVRRAVLVINMTVVKMLQILLMRISMFN